MIIIFQYRPIYFAPRKMKNRRSQVAFTLVELLLALTIFSLISLSLYATFSSGLRLSKRAQEDHHVYQDIHWSVDILSRDLQNAVFFDVSNLEGVELSFEGGPDTVAFLTQTEDGLKYVRYYLKPLETTHIHEVVVGEHHKKLDEIVTFYEEEMNQLCFVREQKSLTDWMTSGSEEQVEDIISFAMSENGLRFSFPFAELDQSLETQETKVIWKDSWALNYLPSAIEVSLSFLYPDKEQEPVRIKRKIIIPTGYVGIEEAVK